MEDEEIITTDVPETSENEELEEVDVSTSEDIETEETQERDIEKEIEERANQLFEEKVKDRLDRYKKSEKENLRKYKYLEDVIKTGTGTDNLDDAIKETVDFYRGNEIEIPEYSNYSEDDERILGQARAKDFIKSGYEEMEAEANRIANIPREQRTVRETEEFNILGAELTRRNNIKELKAKGYDVNVLETEDFKEFSNQFNDKVDISKVYEMYNKLNGTKVEKPYSPGSAKTTSQVKQIKDYYSPEDFDKLTDEDLNNPKIMEIVDKSRLQWYKK